MNAFHACAQQRSVVAREGRPLCSFQRAAHRRRRFSRMKAIGFAALLLLGGCAGTAPQDTSVLDYIAGNQHQGAPLACNAGFEVQSCVSSSRLRLVDQQECTCIPRDAMRNEATAEYLQMTH